MTADFQSAGRRAEVQATLPADWKSAATVGAVGQLALRTTGGSRIIWGRAPGSDRPGELSAEQKIGRMEEYLARKGGFTDPQGPLEIDIRHWKEITARPLGDDGTRTRE